MVLQQTARILDRSKIQQKITRIAYEIYEQNFSEREIVLAGIYRNGYELANMLAEELRKISPLQVTVTAVKIDKTNPLAREIRLEPQPELTNKVIILVDDVLNTGKTLAYSFRAFLSADIKKIQTATLINRNHTLFPVSATYSGYSLATTLNERVEVVLTDDETFGAYLV